MAHTYGVQRFRDVWGSRYVRKLSITLVDNYVTGGWPLVAQDLGFGRTSQLGTVIVLNPAVAGAILSWDDTNKKLMARAYAGTEIANASAALAGVVVEVLAIATGQQT